MGGVFGNAKQIFDLILQNPGAGAPRGQQQIYFQGQKMNYLDSKSCK